MNLEIFFGDLRAILYALLQIGFIVRVLLKPNRQPVARLAWIVLILAIPLIGMFVYLMFGETNIGRRRTERMHKIISRLPKVSDAPGFDDEQLKVEVPEQHAHLFRVGQTVNGFEPIGGNQAHLTKDSNDSIASIVADIDAAQDHVHVNFYIWLPDNNGLKMVEALKRAASRGVTCRALADNLGSRQMIKSRHWRDMRKAGVKLAIALPISNPLLLPIKGRIDLRNHRKNVVIDNNITYCGSQNCADPEFRIKAKYAPWVDAMMRFQGPIARQNQYLFASDWEAETEEDLSELLKQPLPDTKPGFPAQVIGTGPTVRFSAMPEIFEMLMYTARRELVISTPYFVPDESMQAALCASSRRGVATTIIFPARNDSWVVGAASRSFYAELLEAGVNIFEFKGGLLHTKSLTMDGEVSLIGSANMDRRSFELNYENNILFYDSSLTAEMRKRQDSYIVQSDMVTPEMVENWSWQWRLWNNAVAMLGPVL